MGKTRERNGKRNESLKMINDGILVLILVFRTPTLDEYYIEFRAGLA